MTYHRHKEFRTLLAQEAKTLSAWLEKTEESGEESKDDEHEREQQLLMNTDGCKF